MASQNQLLAIIFGAAALYLLMQNQANAQQTQVDTSGGVDTGGIDTSGDGTIYDARDAWAQSTDINVDNSVLDARDAWAEYVPWLPDENAVPDEYQQVSFLGVAMPWSESLIPAKYLSAIRAAEAKYGLPKNLLARLLYQESRYREDIITGQVHSSVGAVGIAQFMPATAKALGIDPSNVGQSIYGAAQYLKQLYEKTGDWAKALAAYNWGIGNVMRKGLQAAPTETQNYYKDILADIGMTPGLWA